MVRWMSNRSAVGELALVPVARCGEQQDGAARRDGLPVVLDVLGHVAGLDR